MTMSKLVGCLPNCKEQPKEIQKLISDVAEDIETMGPNWEDECEVYADRRKENIDG